MSNLNETLRNSVADIKTNYGTGREMIRNALESCYSLYCDIMNDPKYRTPLRNLYKERGLKETANTDAATKLIRLTIVESSKKANPYAQVFRIAHKHQVKPDEFLAWLDEHGGIERVRLSKNPISDDAKPQVSRSWSDIEDAAMGYVANLSPAAKVTFADGKGIAFKGSVAMLVVTRTVDTDDVSVEPLNIVEVIDSDKPRLKSLLQYYSEQATN
jgi:hypothetical protein